MNPDQRPALTREKIVDAAVALLDEVGLDALSMRRLASRLGVQSPAIYWHFRSKRELMESVAERIYLEGGMGPPLPEERWEEWFARRAHTYRSALNAHRDGARVAGQSTSGSPALQAMFAEELEALTGFGFTPTLAMQAISVFSHYVTGFVLREQATPPPAATPGESPISESVFELGIRLMIDGLAVGR